jgi:FxsC-like protein
MHPLYESKGLRYLKKLEPTEYERCVIAFAEAIKNAWETHKNIPELPNVAPFEDIPNTFAGGNWEEAAGPQGWLPGPNVANFVYAAGLSHELPQQPVGRYGTKSSEWRPYLPPEPATICEIAKSVTGKQSLRYREIPIDHNLEAELQSARDRKNLTVVVADPNTLTMQQYQPVTVFDKAPWEGTALLMPWDESLQPWDEQLQKTVTSSFPIRSQSKAPPFQAPILTVADLAKTLDVTLTDLRAAVTQAGAQQKEKTDEPPAQVVGPSRVDL